MYILYLCVKGGKDIYIYNHARAFAPQWITVNHHPQLPPQRVKAALCEGVTYSVSYTVTVTVTV